MIVNRRFPIATHLPGNDILIESMRDLLDQIAQAC